MYSEYVNKIRRKILDSSDAALQWSLMGLIVLLLSAIPVIVFAGFGNEITLGNDAPNILDRSIDLLKTGEPSPLDPPLRYVPWAGAYLLFGTASAATTAYATTVLLGLPVLAVTVALLSRELSGSEGALYTLLFFLVGFGLFLLRLPWGDDWMYISPLPLVFLALYFIHRDLHSEANRFGIFAGLTVGLIGLQQIWYGGIMALILLASYTVDKNWKSLIIAVLPGAPAAPVALSYLIRRQNIASSKTELVSLPHLLTKPVTIFRIDLVGMDAPPTLFIVLGSLLLWHTRDRWSTPVLTASMGILLPAYFLPRLLFSSGWATSLSAFILQFIILVALVDAYRDKLPEIVSPSVYPSVVVIVFTASAALLHWIVHA